MSQHHFFTLHHDKKTHILLGWDKPLQGFFLVIEKEDDIDNPFWSNLDIKDSHPKKLDTFIMILKNMNIKLPDTIEQEVIRDSINNVVNKIIIHSYKNNVYKRIADVDGVYITNESIPALYDKYGVICQP